MENIKNNKILPIIFVLLIIGGLYVLYVWMSGVDKTIPVDEPASSTNQSDIVTVKNTPLVRGSLTTPPGFPEDIPIEAGQILESATTNYPNSKIEQLSLSYHSSKTVNQKFDDYKKYMQLKGYQITDSSASSPTKALFGTTVDTNLSVAISNSEGKTLVQLSYLLKAVQ